MTRNPASRTSFPAFARICRPLWAAISILSLLPLTSCARYQARQERAKNQFFAEILKRESRRTIGEDRFFDRNLLANPYAEVRRWCAVALGRIASPRALPLLYRAVRTGDAAARAASAFAIGAIEDRELLEERYLDPDPGAAAELSRLLDDPSLTVRMRAVEALGKIGSHAQAAEIARRLDCFPYRGQPAERAYLDFSITALARLKDPAALPALEKLAGSSDSEIRWRALDALVRLQSKGSGPLFIKNLEHPGAEVRSYAALGLGVVEDPGLAPLLSPLLPPRREPTGTAIPLSVRFCALQALGKLKNPAVLPSLRAALLADPIDGAHPDQQMFAIQAATTLGLIGATDGEAALVPLLEFPGPVANHAVIALARILKGNPDRFFGLVDGRRFASPSALPAWAAAMAELGGPHAADELHRMLVQIVEKSSVLEMETLPAVLAALAKTDAPGLQDTLAPFLGSHDAALLLAAIAAYKPERGAPAPWAPIVRAFTVTAASSNIEARIEILSYLKPWIRRSEVQQVLRSGLEDPERNVRLACAALLRRGGATDIAEDAGSSNRPISEAFCQALAASRKNSTIARFDTTRGALELELFREDAPFTVANFVLLAKSGAYDGLEFDRVVPLHRIEGASPRTRLGLSRALASEINMRPFERGSVGVARTGGYSEMGRLFITLAPEPYLDGSHTCLGRVISGMQVADRIVPGDRIRRVSIKETISSLDYYRY